MPYYSVKRGVKPGIYHTWSKCEENVKGFSGAIYKKFKNLDEAKEFLDDMKIFTINKKERESSSNNIFIYTDGACSKNGTIYARAGFGIYFGKDDPRNISQKVNGKQTNNVAELLAILKAYEIVKGYNKNITIVSDSEYAIKCCQGYGKRCQLNNWKRPDGNDIPNLELVKNAYHIFKNNKNINFKYIAAHTGKKDIHSIGNDNADRLARLAIEK